MLRLRVRVRVRDMLRLRVRVRVRVRLRVRVRVMSDMGEAAARYGLSHRVDSFFHFVVGAPQKSKPDAPPISVGRGHHPDQPTQAVGEG
jgi:hypothetical protein